MVAAAPRSRRSTPLINLLEEPPPFRGHPLPFLRVLLILVIIGCFVVVTAAKLLSHKPVQLVCGEFDEAGGSRAGFGLVRKTTHRMNGWQATSRDREVGNTFGKLANTVYSNCSPASPSDVPLETPWTVPIIPLRRAC